MEHAALGLARAIRSRAKEGASVLIVAGKGNNGADGIALARLLQDDFTVRLFLPFELKSDMAKLQLKRAQALGIVVVADIIPSDVVVDCILGSGFEGELDTPTCELLGQLNALEALKIACDIPTGIDIHGRLSPIAFDADITVTMGAYKEALFLDMAKDSIGEIIKVDLGVDSALYEDASDLFLLEADDLRLPSR
ncbi:MAG: NAD(P)H-hydrate epimerase, partial [Sulfurovaceae bacterium]